ncbi:hypothetical protein TNCV_1816611 [Trichonephila clavipes]|nr:hypothetical protein TNCV_1816611 [Trichonephila clavipes]
MPAKYACRLHSFGDLVMMPPAYINVSLSQNIHCSGHISIVKQGVDSSNGSKTRLPLFSYFHKRILFCDEAHFWLNGYVNKQNCHVWSEANPQVYVETPLNPEKLFGALYGLLESFKNDEGHNVTFNGDRYRAMITKFFIPELNNHDVQEL